MKIKMLIGREVQDQSVDGCVRLLDTGIEYDLPDALARGLINAGSAVEAGSYEENGEPTTSADGEVEQKQESDAVRQLRAELERSRQTLAKCKSPEAVDKWEKKVDDLEAQLNETIASEQENGQ